MSRFHAPEDSVTEQSVRMAYNYEYMVPVEAAWQLEQALNEARDTVLRLRKQRAIARNFGEQMERERDEVLSDLRAYADKLNQDEQSGAAYRKEMEAK